MQGSLIQVRDKQAYIVQLQGGRWGLLGKHCNGVVGEALRRIRVKAHGTYQRDKTTDGRRMSYVQCQKKKSLVSDLM